MTIHIYVRASTKDQDAERALDDLKEFASKLNEEIKEYVNSKDPMDKAGSYGIQGAWGAYVKGIRGDYNNVVGLPVARLIYETKKLGMNLRG